MFIVCVCVCVHSHAMEWMWGAKEQFKGVGSLLPLCGFGYWTQVFRLGNKFHYLLSYLSRPTDNVLLNQPDNEEPL